MVKREDRLKKEYEYVEQNQDRCYNDTGKEPLLGLNQGVIRPFMAEGKEYRSTRAAAKALGIWRAEIKRRLSNPSKEDWYY